MTSSISCYRGSGPYQSVLYSYMCYRCENKTVHSEKSDLQIYIYIYMPGTDQMSTEENFLLNQLLQMLNSNAGFYI